MFKQLSIFKAKREPVADPDRLPFTPCSASQAQSIGFDPRPVVAGFEHVIIERKTVPAEVVKRRLDKAVAEVEQETGRRPKGKALRDMKENIQRELLTTAHARRKSIPILWLPDAGLLLVGSTSNADVDAITWLLCGSEPGLELQLVQTQRPVAATLTDALTEGALEVGEYMTGRSCAMLGDDGKVKFVDHTLTGEARVLAQIESGKQVVELAFFSERVEFALNADLQLKGIKAIKFDSTGDHADAYAADCHLWRAEMNTLVSDVLESCHAA